jgi:hypothetical protein
MGTGEGAPGGTWAVSTLARWQHWLNGFAANRTRPPPLLLLPLLYVLLSGPC